MATRRRSEAQVRREQLLAAATYPLDWLEERSGLVGGVRYFLFRKVPSDTNWMQTLGSATLTAFVVQALTGVILAMYYKPSPHDAYSSIQNITDHVTLGWLVRGMHKWGASVFIILLFLHMGRVFLFGAYKYPRELNWIVGVNYRAIGEAERAIPPRRCGTPSVSPAGRSCSRHSSTPRDFSRSPSRRCRL